VDRPGKGCWPAPQFNVGLLQRPGAIRSGTEMPLIDGGAFDWLQKLATDRRAVFIASGTGAQLMALRFRSGQPPP
jgi:hypothetical protein